MHHQNLFAWLSAGFLALNLTACESLFGSPEETGPSNLGVGEACENREQCRSGLTCRDGLCQPVGDRQEGSTCILTGECAGGLYCSATGFCADAGDGELGQGCVTSGDCVPGLYCEYWGLSGICQSSGTGDLADSCTTTADCMAGLGCGPTGNCIQGLPAGGLVTFSGGECPSDEIQPDDPFQVLFHVPRTGGTATDFYSLPFPNDIRLRTGHIDMSGHPRPELDVLGNIVATLLDLIEEDLTGFGLNETIFFRFNTFPDGSSLQLSGDDQVLYLVNIDPDSQDYAQRKSLIWSATSTRGLYICDNWMGVRPFWDDPFHPDTTYAAVITDGIRGIEDRLPQQSPDFAAMVSDTQPSDPDLREAWEMYAPLRSYFEDQDISPDTIMGAAVFTTGQPTYRQPGIYQAVQNSGTISTSDLVLCESRVTSPCDDGLAGTEHQRGCFGETDEYYEIHTTVEVPIFQEGTPPYLEQGGSFILDESSVPIQQGTQDVCTVITIPKDRTMPTGGWPVVVFAHGTGGSFLSHLGLLGADLSELGYATIGFDGVQHGTRRGESVLSPEVLFFNFANPRAAAGNILQGSADAHFFGRFASQLQVAAQASPTGAAIQFDAARIVFFGHSQGGTVGVLALSQDDVYAAAILSGTGGGLILSLVEKTSPIDIAHGLELIFPDENLNDFHPVMNLVQLYFDPVDPLNYGPGLLYQRPEDLVGMHLFQSYGLSDTYTPPRSIRELGMAIDLPVMTPVLEDYPRPSVDPPVTGNVSLDGEDYTCVLGQYNPPTGEDGHFVIFDNETARAQMLGFLQTLLTEDVPTVPAP